MIIDATQTKIEVRIQEMHRWDDFFSGGTYTSPMKPSFDWFRRTILNYFSKFVASDLSEEQKELILERAFEDLTWSK